MTQYPDPTAEPTAEPTPEPTADPSAGPAPAAATRPFRVEPAVPVPDDARPSSPQAPSAVYQGVTVRRGPRPGAVVLGLLSMLIAAYVIAANVSGAHLELRVVGPALVGALGGLLLLVGLAGVVVGRLRR
ncbi:MAG: hypothetical protein ABI336_12710 [Humibacillus sp.]